MTYLKKSMHLYRHLNIAILKGWPIYPDKVKSQATRDPKKRWGQPQYD